MSTMQESAEREVEMAKREYREAYDSGDSEKLMNAQEALTNASLKLDRAKNFKPTLQEDETEVQLPQRSQADNKTQQVDPKYAAWQRRNSNWFNKDEEMTEAAKGLHMKLYREYGPEYIGTDDYYERIDKTIRKRFPESFPENRDVETKPQQRSKPSTVVASAKRSTAPKQIKLTATQAALAKKFRLTPEQYAREVLKLEK
jgi:predicted helicase